MLVRAYGRRLLGGAGGRNLILCYHRVLPEGDPYLSWGQRGMSVTVSQFEAHMALLARHFRVVALEELREDGGDKLRCAITFDDGWADTAAWAAPVLARHGFPATVFVTTGWVGGSRWPWPDRVSLLCRGHEGDRAFWAGCRERLERSGFQGDGPAPDSPESLIGRLKEIHPDRTEAWMEEWAGALGASFGETRLWMDWEELGSIGRAGVLAGAHTHSHAILPRLAPDEVGRELSQCRRTLAEGLGMEPLLFSYPNGSWTEDVRGQVAGQGFRIAVTTRRTPVTPEADPFTWGRVLIHGDAAATTAQFACRLSGRFRIF